VPSPNLDILSYVSYAVMDNYKNAPQFLYGLNPSQMDMFINADNPIHQMSERVTEVLIIYIQLNCMFGPLCLF